MRKKLEIMKRFLIIAFIAFSFKGIAQQQEQYSLYMMNNFLVNPAEGGTEEFIDLKLGYRTQWVGLEGAPQTGFISGHGAVGKKTSRFEEVKQLPYHGVGGIVQTDQIGVWNTLDVKASYSYHLPVSEKLIISFGTFIGVKQLKYDAASAEFEYDPSSGQGVNNDAAFANQGTRYAPDATLGIWAYSDNYYIGVSSFQLFGNTMSFEEYQTGNTDVTPQDAQAKLARHYWFTGGYRFGVGEHHHIIPSFVMKVVDAAPPQFDINAKFRYEDKYWLGASYRNLDAIVLLAGITIKKIFDIGYAYDANISNLNSYNTGSHEIMIGLRLPNHKHEPAPAQFW